MGREARKAACVVRATDLLAALNDVETEQHIRHARKGRRPSPQRKEVGSRASGARMKPTRSASPFPTRLHLMRMGVSGFDK